MNENRQPLHFEYLEFPALRFIGVAAWRTQEEWDDMWRRKEDFSPTLEEMKEQISPIMPYRCAFMHHDDGEVDKINRYLIGHFFDVGTPVPEGYDYHDLKPQTAAYAVFHGATFQDLFVRYEVTRDKILSDGMGIPYPVGYWHAEVYFEKTPDEEGLLNCGVLFSCHKSNV